MRWTLPPTAHAFFARHGERVVFAVVFVVATGLALKNLLGTYADLGIYLDVAREFSTGGANIYRDRPNSGPWLYPHLAVLPFALLLQAFGDTGARIGWCVLLGLGTAWTVRSAARAVAPLGGLRPWQWFVFAVLFQRCFAQNLTHGQLSLWVGAFAVAGTAALVQGRARAAGLWLGIAASLKLTPVLFLVALPLMGRWRAAVAMAGTIVVAVLLVPWPFCGTDEHLRHLQDFAHSVQQAVLTPEQATITQSYAGPSVRGALDYLLQPRPLDAEGHRVNLFEVEDTTLATTRRVWSAVLLALLGSWFWRARRLPDAARLAHQASAVAVTLSLFAPLLRVYHLTAAVVPFVLFCTGPGTARSKHRWRDPLWCCGALVLLLAMTLRQKKLLGETLWRAFDGGAFLHLGLVLLVVWLARQAGRPNEERS